MFGGSWCFLMFILTLSQFFPRKDSWLPVGNRGPGFCLQRTELATEAILENIAGTYLEITFATECKV